MAVRLVAPAITLSSNALGHQGHLGLRLRLRCTRLHSQLYSGLSPTGLSPSWELLRPQTHVVPARRPPGAPTGHHQVGYCSLVFLLWKVRRAQPPTVTHPVTWLA